MISCFHGHHCDLQQLRCRFPQSMAGVNLRQLMNLAEALQLTSRAVRLEPEDLPCLTMPCILHWNMDHFVVLAALGRRHATVYDPARGVLKIGFPEFSDHYTGVALELNTAGLYGPAVETYPGISMLSMMRERNIPVVLGSGIPLFGELQNDVQLNHVATRSYEFGFVQLQYEVSKTEEVL